MTVRLRISDVSKTDVPTVQDAKQLAAAAGWLTDRSVLTFERFISIEDFNRRVVHEYDAESRRWYPVEMWEGAQP